MSHILLALETSGTRCGVALLQGDLTDAQVLSDHHDGTQEHAERLLPMVSALLARAGLTPADLQAVAFGQGPGGFTGLRVACGVAQGMAMALGLPVVPVGSLQAIAHDVVRGAHPTVVAVAMDARMGEAYAAVFLLLPRSADLLADAPAPIVVQAPILIAADDLGAWLADAAGLALPVLQAQGFLAQGYLAQGFPVQPCACVLAGDAWSVHADRVAPPDTWARDASDRPRAEAVARLGLQALAQGRTIDAADAQPLYVRDKVAYTTAERAGGLGGNPKAAAHGEPGAQA